MDENQASPWNELPWVHSCILSEQPYGHGQGSFSPRASEPLVPGTFKKWLLSEQIHARSIKAGSLRVSAPLQPPPTSPGT